VSRSRSRIGSWAARARKPLGRGLTAAAAVLALVATLGLIPSPAAADDVRAPATPRTVVKGDPYKLVGAKVAAQLRAGQSINQHATGPKRKVLDYKLAKKYDKGNSTVRRQFAASWLWTGRSIKNISKKERQIVRSYVKKYFGKRTPSGARGHADAASRCRGKDGFESLGGGQWNAYLNSCSTAVIIGELQVGGIIVGYVATKAGPYAPVGLLAAGLMEIGSAWIATLRDLSPYSAVYVMRRLIGPSTARQQILTMLPQ
jgi:hypothetical protein